MVKILFQVLFGLLLLSGANGQHQMRFPNSYYFPENWPQHILRLSEKGTLKDIFDSGIRPSYLPNGSEYSQLVFKHVRLTIQQSNGESLPEFAVDYADVRPKPSGLSVIDLTSHALTLEDARDEMSKWLPYIGKSTDELDAFLVNVRAKYASFDDVTFSPAPNEFKGRWTGENKEVFEVWLQKAFSEEVPLRMRLIIGWYKLRTPIEQKTFYEGSIPSPEGYEDYQMQETKHWGPDDMSEMKYAKGIPFVAGRGLGGVPHNVIEVPENPTSGVSSRNRPRTVPSKSAPLEPAEPENGVWTWAIGISIFLSAGFFIWRWKISAS